MGGGSGQTVAFRIEARFLGLSITNHVTSGQAPFLLCASVSLPVKQGQLLVLPTSQDLWEEGATQL